MVEQHDTSAAPPPASPQQLDVEDAGRELRRILISGRLDEAERIACLLERLQEDDAGQLRSDREALLWIVDGIQAVLSQDTRQGIANLERAATVTSADDSLKWVALHWMANGAVSQGQLPRAERAALESVELAAKISPQAHSLSLLSLAEIASLMEDPTKALDYLRTAIGVLREVQDDRGASTALLAMARTLYRVGKEQDGQQTALNAALADPSWPDAAVFLSERALAGGDTKQAIELLRPFTAQTPCPPVVERQRWLIDGLRKRRYDALDVANLLRLRDGRLEDDVLAEMRTGQVERPEFYQLHELLAWSLYKLGHTDEAEALFSSMSGLPLDPELRTSVSLGLGCIASGKYTSPASKVKAATGSFPMVTPMMLSGDDLVEVPPPVGPPAAPPPTPPAPSPMLTSTPTKADTVPISLKDLPFRPGGEQPPPQDDVLEALPIETTPGSGLPISTGMTTDAVFVGDLQMLAVPDLLDFLQSSRRTGTLVISSNAGTAAVHMIKGRIAGAASPGGINLGDLLIEREALTREGLESALEHKEERSKQLLLGSILLRLGLVDHQTVEDALVKQVRMALLETVGWTDGRFAFEPEKRGADADPDEIVVDLDTRAVLMDVLREFDEQNR
jgi:tetratricopeptide (TPR) repeat protein